MPYLEVTKNEEEQIKSQVEVPNVTGIPIKDAKVVLEELGLEYEVDTENLDEIIKDQLPKKGIRVNQGTRIILYY